MIKGRALDNVLTEQPWLTRKYEEVCLHDDATPKEERRGIDGYFDFYNHWRPHQSLVYQTLAEACFHTATARQKQTAVIKSTLAAKGK